MVRRRSKRRSAKAGLPPGSLVHIGERKREKARITLLSYSAKAVDQRVVETPAECFPERLPRDGVSWINVDGLHDVEVLEKLGTAYKLHPLTLEDILNTEQRPKLEEFDDYLFLVLKMLQTGERRELIHFEQSSLILGRDFVLTFQERQGDIYETIRERLRDGKGRIRTEGADYLAYALVDTTVDHYFAVLEAMEERIEKLETDVLEGADSEPLGSLQHLRRVLIQLRRSVWPLREVINALQRSGSEMVRPSTRIYWRDVYDHTMHVIDVLETHRDLMAAILELHLSSVSNRMNNVMKVLTVIATTFIPLTLIAGIYGMNFEYMPELKWPWGYPTVLGLMAGIGLLMLACFKRKRWL